MNYAQAAHTRLAERSCRLAELRREAERRRQAEARRRTVAKAAKAVAS